MMMLVETRIDNAIFRMGFADSRSQARQFASHGLFTLNGKRITIPSISLKVGDIVAPKHPEKFAETELSTASTWIDIDKKKMSGTVKHMPTREEIDTTINENLVIEFYSR
jgi:small subunit ribosomal protein S4